MRVPTMAEQARTAVARARVGRLVTYPRPASPALTAVSVSGDAGAPVLHLAPAAPAVVDLGRRPLGTVRVAPAGCATVTIQGAVRRLASSDGGGLARFRLDVGAVRLGECGTQVVDVEDYWAAEPDPLREVAPGILAHLRHGHSAQLAACLRANGHTRARWDEPRRLDRYGLELAVLDDAGVSTVRLSFTEPVNRAEDLAPGMSLPPLRRERCADCPTDKPN
jgi:hypothetical protein